MADLNSEYFAQLIAGLPQNIGEITKSLSRSLEQNITLQSGDTGSWTGQFPIAGGEEPGLIVALRIGEHTNIVAIPESFSLPTDFKVDGLHTVAVPNLMQAIAESQPHLEAQFVLLTAVTETGAPILTGQICLIGPVAISPVASLETPDTSPVTTGSPVTYTSWDQPLPNHNSGPRWEQSAKEAAPESTTGQDTSAAPKRTRRPSPLLKLPVKVVVMLAEKKIELGQLLALCPGSLVTFEKSCDDMLDLYVNNQRYCRGEAIKIGEHFGLKINEVKPQPTRVTKIL
ncbi:MAG: FliM/FliN family flagellar motor switch protein [Planctomycetaceae bacterium]